MPLPKEIASPLKQLVYNAQIVNALNAYVDYRISVQRKTTDVSDDANAVKKAQGAIGELNVLKKLRDEIIGMESNKV